MAPRANLNREDLAWSAGFFDGEGTTSIYSTRWYPAMVLSVGQMYENREPLERFVKAIGMGSVSKPYKTNLGKDACYVRLYGFEKVQAVIAMLWPWLGRAKRAQYKTVLARWKMGQVEREENFNKRWGYGS